MTSDGGRSRRGRAQSRVAGTLKRSRETEKRWSRLVDICDSLPEVEISWEQHLAFRVRKKTFAYYLFDRHGDGRVALSCKALPGEQSKLVERDPARFFVPAYLGPKGQYGQSRATCVRRRRYAA